MTRREFKDAKIHDLAYWANEHSIENGNLESCQVIILEKQINKRFRYVRVMNILRYREEVKRVQKSYEKDTSTSDKISNIKGWLLHAKKVQVKKIDAILECERLIKQKFITAFTSQKVIDKLRDSYTGSSRERIEIDGVLREHGYR